VHQSENAARLAVRTIHLSDVAEFPDSKEHAPAVLLLVAPPDRVIAGFTQAFHRFAAGLHESSIVAVLATPEDAAGIVATVADVLQFQLWVAVKLARPVKRRGRLPQHHAALLILSRYRSPLRHAKTRVAYTYCPACERTTKDYGGKKHTYHAFGTLLSDVWRDIHYAPGERPTQIIARLADLFGREPYQRLNVIDLSKMESMVSPPRRRKRMIASSGGFETVSSKIVCGDVLTELRKLPNDSIDFAFADPPYNLDKRYDAWDDDIAVGDYLDWCAHWIAELARALKPGRTCAVLNIPLWSVRHFQQLRQAGLEFQNWIAWEGLSLPVRMIMPAHYAIVCFSKGSPRPLPGLRRLTSLREDFCLRASCAADRTGDRQPITDLWWDIHRLKHNSRRVDHPCQLPPTLMRRLIELFTREDEVVLDPFNGAGTTTLCADALGRRYVGIELSPRYHELASSRHGLLRAGADPFAAKATRVPVAKNSRVGRAGRAAGIVRYRVPKKTLQLEVKRVAQLLGGRLPSREELRARGRFPIRYYDEYFVSWGEVCAAARTTGMSERRNIDSPT